MAISNTEKQQRFYKSKIAAKESKISCWLPEDDNERLQRVMKILDYAGKGKKNQGYSEVISLALKELEINLTPPPQREVVRYGLRIMDNRTIK
ncbi:MAG: hypothetical protein K9L22_03815 [Methylococcaceae bacterium]|nr:hypothetical protein [Methylococcaceae bacterium]